MDPTAKEGCGITSVLTKVLERNLPSKCLPKKRKSNQKPNDMASKVKIRRVYAKVSEVVKTTSVGIDIDLFGICLVL